MEQFNKLVRDNVPHIIEEHNESCVFSTLKGEAYSKALREKLKEEVEEYLLTTDDLSSVEELADILEVLRSLVNIHHQSFEELERVRKNKEKIRGGFKEGIFLISKA